MKIRRAGGSDRQAVEGLWAYCFEPQGHPFFEWYFQHVCRMDEVLVGETEGQIACDLHLRPYTLSVRGRAMASDYIVGVATHPAARGRGLAGELLAGALRSSREAGKAVDILMPSDASFYQSLGFALYAHQWRRKASPSRLAALGEKPCRAGTIERDSDWQALRDIYEAYTAGRTGYAVRDASSWQRHTAGQLKEGYIAVVQDQMGSAGYLFYQIAERTLSVSEFCFRSEAGRRGLYAYMASHLGSVDTCVWQEASDDRSYLYWADGAEHTYIQNGTLPYMMARITDPAAAFTGLPAAGNGEVVFRLSDPLLSDNEGVYTLSASGGQLRAERTDRRTPSFSLTCGGAAQLLFGAASVRDLFRYGEAVWQEERRGDMDFLNRVLPETRCWINEWY